MRPKRPIRRQEVTNRLFAVTKENQELLKRLESLENESNTLMISALVSANLIATVSIILQFIL